MSELSPDAVALIRAGRSAFRPDASDRERVLVALSGALGPGAALDGARQAGGAKLAGMSRFASKGWMVGGLAAVAVGTGLAAGWQLWSRAPSHVQARVPAPVATSPVEASPPAGAWSGVVLGSEQPPRMERAPSTARAALRSAGRPSADSLREEVRLLSKAEQEMSQGFAGEALKTLAEHERRFPAGALAEERMAARVQALCASGRTAEAATELTKLASAYPGSPHVQRARRVCGLEVDSLP